jgi:hypothetical protein
MALDLNLLYGEMAVSAALHGMLPFIVFAMSQNLVVMTRYSYISILFVLCVVMSFIFQFGFLTALQQSTCNGVKDLGSIAKGAAVAALTTGVMLAIPVFVEPMRLMVTSLPVIGIPHLMRLDPKDAKNQTVIYGAAKEVTDSVTPPNPVHTQPNELQIETQTRKEMAFGGAYWTAIAGAYGIGIGCMMATGSCGPT